MLTCQRPLQISRDALIAELRRELHESNLAVSEARSLLSANKRQEKELRDRLDKLQRALDNGAVLRANNIQLAQGAEQELRVLRSQYETLQRQYKVNNLWGIHSGLGVGEWNLRSCWYVEENENDVKELPRSNVCWVGRKFELDAVFLCVSSSVLPSKHIHRCVN